MPRLSPTAVCAVIVAAVAVVAPGLGAAAAADPLTDADATVQALRQEADRAAGSYFDALARTQELDAEIQKLEARLPDLAQRRHRLRARAVSRAVAAYMRSGLQLAALIDSSDALAAARRRQLLSGLNARDAALFSQLTRAGHRLREQRRQLRDARAEQERAVADVDATGRDIDAKLHAALDRRNELQAQADAAAAAAPTTTVPPPTVDPTVAAGTPTTAEPPPVPTEPPPGYHPTPGTHRHHDDAFLACTRARESSGNYKAVSPSGRYRGAYQMLQSTWDGGANHADRLELVGVPPNTASEYDQDDVAWAVYRWQGKGPWGDQC